jgi:hypothetical protein
MRLRSQVEHAVLCCLLMIGLNGNESLSTKAMARLYNLRKSIYQKRFKLFRAPVSSQDLTVFLVGICCAGPQMQ